MSPSISARVAPDGSFRMTGLSGSYQFNVNADRQPFVQVTCVDTGGKASSGTAGVEFVDGDHEIVQFVPPREATKSTVDPALSNEALVERFKSEKVFWQQFLIAEQIVERHDVGVIPSLIDWLTHEDRHLRGNAAFIVGRLGDPRGFQVIADILTDRFDRPVGQGSGDEAAGIASPSNRRRSLLCRASARRPARSAGCPDSGVTAEGSRRRYIVPWALRRSVTSAQSLPRQVFDDGSPSMCVLAICAGNTQCEGRGSSPDRAADDHRLSNFGAQASVADAARAAIAKLR